MLPAVPQVAVQQDREGRFVYVVDKKSQVEKRRIKIQAVIGDSQTVKSGLSQGEKVIIQGIQKVKPGMKVKISTDEKRDR